MEVVSLPFAKSGDFLSVCDVETHYFGDIDEILKLLLKFSEFVESFHRFGWFFGALGLDSFFVASDRNEVNVDDSKSMDSLFVLPEDAYEKGVDPRSDIFSLGLLLYYFVNGGKFDRLGNYSVGMSFLGNHTAPQSVQMVIEKMLALLPEDRYQSIYGLMWDLKSSHHMVRRGDGDCLFFPASFDVPNRLYFGAHLYGRESELSLMQSVIQSCSCGAFRMLNICGEMGVGKSALIKKALDIWVLESGFAVLGKVDEISDRPYQAIVSVLEEITTFLMGSRFGDEIRSALNQSLTSNVEILRGFIPGFRRFMPGRSQLFELDSDHSKNRFYHVIKEFLRTLVRFHRPFVIVFDDFHRIDVDSIELIRVILDAKIGQLMIVFSHRNAESSQAHQSLIRDYRDSEGFSELVLAGLSEPVIIEAISYYLKQPEGDVVELGKLLYARTIGNPFYFRQIVRALVDKELLYFDYKITNWIWDMRTVRTIEHADNVGALMGKRVAQLPYATLDMLTFASALGNEFSPDDLGIIFDMSMENILLHLWHAEEGEYIVLLLDGRYKFLHDAIQASSYRLLGEQNQLYAHHKIAQKLHNYFIHDDSQLGVRIFDILHHYNICRSVIGSRSEQLLVARLNLRGALLSKDSAAFQSGKELFEYGLDYLGWKDWQSDFSLAYALYLGLFECEMLCGERDVAEGYFEILLSKIEEKSAKWVELYTLKIQALNHLNIQEEALGIGKWTMQEMGLRVPGKKSLLLHIGLEFGEFFFRYFGLRQKLDLDFKKMEDEVEIAITGLFSVMGAPAFFVDSKFFMYLMAYASNYCLRRGYSEFSGAIFVTLGIVVGPQWGFYRFSKTIGDKGLAINEEYYHPIPATRAYFIYGMFINPWINGFPDSLRHFKKAIETGFLGGDIKYLNYAIANLMFTKIYIGVPLGQVLRELGPWLEMIMEHQDEWSYYQTLSAQLFCKYVNSVKLFAETDFCTSSSLLAPHVLIGKDNLSDHIYFHYSTFTFCVFRDLDLIDQSIPLKVKHPSTLKELYFYPELHFFTALILLQNSKKLTPAFSKRIKLFKQLKSLNPTHFSHYYYLILAERCNFLGQYQKAIQYYLRGIGHALGIRYTHIAAMAQERLGEIYMLTGDKENGEAMLLESYNNFVNWEAFAKVKIMHEKYIDILPMPPREVQFLNLKYQPK